jgi:hypothetical protein
LILKVYDDQGHQALAYLKFGRGEAFKEQRVFKSFLYNAKPAGRYSTYSTWHHQHQNKRTVA